MSDEQCIHGMTRAWCSACRAPIAAAAPAGADPYGGRSTQLLFDDLCALLDVPRYVPGPGSTPARVFSAAAARAKVKGGSMPEVGEAIATKAGLVWSSDCDNRRTRQDGTVVSREGVGVVVQALRILTTDGSPA